MAHVRGLWRRVIRTGGVACLVLPAMATQAPKEKKEAPPKKLEQTPRKEPRYVRRTCGKGVELRLDAAEASQGSLFLVEVRSAGRLEGVTGEWGGHTIPFWLEEQARGKGRDARVFVYRALAGVDLERAAGRYEFAGEVQTQDGERASCKAMVRVKARRFATERLKVEKEFVEPSPEQVARAEEERQRLRGIFASATPERLWEGRFQLPLKGIARGSNFGRRRILNGEPRSPHSGTDFPAATGTPVHAAQRGRVVLAEALFFSGNTVVIDHGLGVYTFYGHLEAVSVRVGEAVEAGAVLGSVGATGRVTGPHLHWGLTVNEARVNPLEIVRLLGGSQGRPTAARGTNWGRSYTGRGQVW